MNTLKLSLAIILLFSFSVCAFGQTLITEQNYEINGTTIFVKTIGTGAPLLIAHGGPGLGHDYLVEPFRQLADQYKLIFYDQRGCGRSAGFKEDDTVSIQTMVKDLEELRKELKLEKINLVGQSWGTLIALNYAFSYEQHIKKLLLLEPAPGSTEYLPQIQKTILERLTPSEKEQLAALMQSPELKKNPEIFKEFMQIRTDTYFYDTTYARLPRFEYFDSSSVQKFFSSSAKFSPYLMNYDLYSQMESITLPILIVHGDADVIPNEAIERMCKAIKTSALHIIKNCGHFVHIEKPDQYFNLIREFLEN